MTSATQDTAEMAYFVVKESGSRWARVYSRSTGIQVAKFDVMGHYGGTNGWDHAHKVCAKLNAKTTTTTDQGTTMSATQGPVDAFDAFLNEPPEHEDRRMVREYRHAAYAKWRPVLDEVLRLREEVKRLNATNAWDFVEKAAQRRILDQEAEIARLRAEVERVHRLHTGLMEDADSKYMSLYGEVIQLKADLVRKQTVIEELVACKDLRNDFIDAVDLTNQDVVDFFARDDASWATARAEVKPR